MLKLIKNNWKRIIPLAACGVMIISTTANAATNRYGSIKSDGIINYELEGTNQSVLIDADDIKDNAKAIDVLDAQLNDLSFKYGTENEVLGNGSTNEKKYYWAKNSNGSWVKIGAVGNAEPWMVLSNDGTNAITFSSESGVDIAGTMDNKAGTTQSATASINGDSLRLQIPTNAYYTTNSYLTMNPGSAAQANVLKGKTFTSTSGVNVAGTMNDYSSSSALASSITNVNNTVYVKPQNTGYYTSSSTLNTGIAWKGALTNALVESFAAGYYTSNSVSIKSGTISSGSASNQSNYLGISVPAAGYYKSGTILKTGILYNPKGTAAAYSASNNGGNLSTSSSAISLAGSAVNLPVGQKITIPAGYYSSAITINNAVKSYATSTAQTCNIANTNSKLYVKPANNGYYTTSSSFNTGIAYNPNKSVASSKSTAAATGVGNTSSSNINLAVDQKVTIPAGYYPSATVIQNVADEGSAYNNGWNAGLASTTGTANASTILNGYTAWVNGN
ncbi:MAG: hypothetical protein K6E54_07475, partial [Bacteroidaceae bacterium]|nr:hypothetical protein [Bacteroidaceae bacterium]